MTQPEGNGLAFEVFGYDLLQLMRVAVAVISTYVVGLVGTMVIRGIFRKTPLPQNVEAGIVRFFRIIVYIAGLFAVVSQLGIDLTGIAVGLGAFSIAVSFAMSTVIQNLVSGVLVMSDRVFVAGDEITVLGLTGRVVKIGLRTTVIEQEGGHRVFVPNSVFITNPVVRKASSGDRHANEA